MGPSSLQSSRATRPPNVPYIFVSVANLRQSKVPNAILSTLGLGSCLAVTCYDPTTHAGALLHAMLPDSSRYLAQSDTAAMFLDLGIPAMLELMRNLDADMGALQFRAFGGAQIVQASDYFCIGRQNIEMMETLVARHQLNVLTWEVGGHCNRSIELHLENGRVLLRMPGKAESWL